MEEFFTSGVYLKGLYISEETRTYNGNSRHYALFSVGTRAIRVKIPDDIGWIGGTFGDGYEIAVAVTAVGDTVYYTAQRFRSISKLDQF